jgi:membrane-associated phospholipid phosphatase
MISDARRALMVALAMLAGFGLLTVLVAARSSLRFVQALDDRIFSAATSVTWGPLVDLGKVLSFVGGSRVVWPVRVLVILLLIFRRHWVQLTAFALAVITSEALIGPMKALIDRPRPPHPLIVTSGASFPSGHAIAGAVTAVGLVVVLVAPGPRRWRWEVWAVVFATIMALSRVYLSAHWFTDVLAGALLGGGLALGWPAGLQLLRERRLARSSAVP